MPESTLIVFAGPNEFAYNDLTQAISDETDKALSPEWVCLIYPCAYCEEVSAKLQEQDDALAPLAPDTVVVIYGYDNSGKTSLIKVIRGGLDINNEIPLASIQRQGLATLFARRGGLLEAGPTAHFIKPSGKVDSRFLRASHALSEGAEIFFTAFWILPFLTEDVRYIHVDTSSIASVAFAALLMKGNGKLPIIQTFQSYGGMKDHNFSKSRLEIVIISASQSGSMAKDIASKVKEKNYIITLYGMNVADTPGTILCDLTFDLSLNPRGLKPARQISDVSRSRPIKLIGEHFVAEPGPPKAIVPALKHAPNIVNDVLSRLQGKNIFSAHPTEDDDTVNRGIWVDTSELSKTDVFMEWVSSLVSQKIPASARAIIHIGKAPQAKILTYAILKNIRDCGGELKGIEVISLEDVENNAEKPRWPTEEIPIIVAAGAIGHGADLLATSRALRKWAPNSHRIYLSLATMPSSRKAFKFLESNLKQPNHKFYSLFDLFVDRDTAGKSWTQERLLLAENQDDLPTTLSTRLDQLNSVEGLKNNLFLAGKKGPLALRDNFAFWPIGTNCSDANHADVFVSISAITTSMRSNEDLPVNDRLINDSQTHSVISSGAFTRYNDGIIQAALLRAAFPVELNYSDAPEHSRLIADLIIQMCNLVDRFQGEALSEFLLALVLERLTLMTHDAKRVKEKLDQHREALSEIQKWFAERFLVS
nr:hypothetical protein [Acetobacter persici]